MKTTTTRTERSTPWLFVSIRRGIDPAGQCAVRFVTVERESPTGEVRRVFDIVVGPNQLDSFATFAQAVHSRFGICLAPRSWAKGERWKRSVASLVERRVG